MKRHVTGCKHFRDPVLETEYKCFALQSDNIKLVGGISLIYVTSPITPILIGMSQANIISIVMTCYF